MGNEILYHRRTYIKIIYVSFTENGPYKNKKNKQETDG